MFITDFLNEHDRHIFEEKRSSVESRRSSQKNQDVQF